jgi:putative selenium metabolism hydrolase
VTADLDPCVDFLQRLIRTEGLPGHEQATAELVRDEMARVGYSDVEIDAAGNVQGRIPGGDGSSMMFNTHLDHVDVGDHARWPHPPFGAEIHDDCVWGRGAVDIKGPLAAQVYGVARLLADPSPPAGDVWVSAVVQEEIGGVGARYMATQMSPPVVIVGEPSRNQLRRGHRGRSLLTVHITGRSVHASVPEQGVSPYDVLAKVLSRLPEIEMATQADLGASSVAPTLIRTDNTSSNVIPGELWLDCDWRHVPGETGHDAQKKLQALLDDCLVPGATATAILPVKHLVSWTGHETQMQGNNPAYILAEDHPALVAACSALEPVIGPSGSVGTWNFATDGGHFSAAGLACVGFGPGDEGLAHTVNEHIPIEHLSTGMDGNAALARALTGIS